jgi:chromodomain-helicase-DNA-binding protein 1
VYRFISKDSIEEDIIDRAKRKMVLEYSIISTMDTSGGSVMQKKSAKGSQSDKVSNEELQTILKFGAQNLFQNTAEKTDVPNRLEEMNLDDILARAEVQEGVEQSGTALGSAEFLTQFHVSDVAQMSWDELIPEDLRETAEDVIDEVPEEFMQDSRRRTAAVDYSGSEFIETSKRKRKPRSTGDSNSLTDKEKRSIVRSLQKYGDWKNRLDDIMTDADLNGKNPEAVKETIVGIIGACENANKSNSRAARKSAMATFEGVSGINATLLLQRVADLEFLNTRLATQNLANFRITWTTKPVSNWSVPWGNKEDAMLLVGIYKHGYGAWAQMKDDTTLPFAKKFFLAQNDKNLPGTIHLQRRADFLLKQLRELESKKYTSQREKFFHPKKPKPSNGKQKGEGTKKVVAPAEISDYESLDESYCKEMLKPVRKNLKSLAAPSKYVTEKKEMAAFIRENLVLVGNHIIDHLDNLKEKETLSKKKKHLWKYASYFWPTDISSKKYRGLFSRMLESSIENPNNDPSLLSVPSSAPGPVFNR